MSLRVALLDYGAGNLASVRKALRAVGADVSTPFEPADLADAGAVVVPGVGHFSATAALGEAWHDALRRVVSDGRSLLGICLGMQWLFEGSGEAPGVPGLGLFRGTCRHLGDESGFGAACSPGPLRAKIPHVGWNDVQPVGPSCLLEGLTPHAQAYFTHSFAVPVTGATVATTEHGVVFASVVERGRVFGVQFHPEKSGPVGLAVLRNFARAAAGA